MRRFVEYGRRRFIGVLTGQGPVGFHRRSLQTLAFEEVRPSPDKPYAFTALVVHGLLGSGRNWRSFSKSLASALLPAQWRLVMVDLRNHGNSAELDGFLPPHDLINAAEDLANLVKSKGWKWPDVVIGHSLGGKIALQFAQSCASGYYGNNFSLPKQLWVLDSVPGKVNSIDGEVEKVLNTLQSLPSTIPSRRWLVDHLLKMGYSKSLSEWLGTNLKKAGEGEQMNWGFNLDGAIQMFHSYRESDHWELLENPPKGIKINIVRAEESDRWTADVIHQLERINVKEIHEDEGQVSFHVLPKSGHWVHVDNPKGLLQLMAPKLASVV